MMMHIREDCIPTSLSFAARHWLSGKRPIMIFMGIIQHGWNVCLPTFGFGGLGGFQGCHRKDKLLLGAGSALCRNTWIAIVFLIRTHCHVIH